MGFFHRAYGTVICAALLLPCLAIVIARRRRGHAERSDAGGTRAWPMPSGSMTVTAIVPTKNRSRLLTEAVGALLAQTARIDELIVVDRSADATGRRLVEGLVADTAEVRRPALLYILDDTITGVAAARNVALDRATGDVIVFCDGDVVPEPSVLETLLRHDRAQPSLAGIAPVIVNHTAPTPARRLHDWLFTRGPFRDERLPVYRLWRSFPPGTLAPVRMFAGAMMSFRRAALAGVRADARFRGASLGEDVDLCWSVTGRGGRLAIAVDAHIVHNRAPRPPVRPEEAMITSRALLCDKHLPRRLSTRVAFAWYVAGVLTGAMISALDTRTFSPLGSAAAGLRALWTDDAG